MKSGMWNKFVKVRDNYRTVVAELEKGLPELRTIQQKLADNRVAAKTSNSGYIVETPIVYNNALDDITRGDNIRLILAADNPGRREQAAENRRYLVGPSGKIAENFFRGNSAFGVDFRRDVVILNKTPIHTPRTAELRELCRLGGSSFEKALILSQQIMARLLLEFHQALYDADAAQPEAARDGILPFRVWIIGYSEMKKNGIFEAYTETLRDLYMRENAAHFAAGILLFRHFSMNQFTSDLRRQSAPEKNTAQNLESMGAAYRKRILGW